MLNLKDFLSEDDDYQEDNNTVDQNDDENTPEDPDENQELNDDLDNTDPNHMGVERTVANAHLVYKRQDDDSTFKELWIYNAQETIKNDHAIRREILSGTDIETGQTASEDGTQIYSLYSVGDIQLLQIKGLPQ